MYSCAGSNRCDKLEDGQAQAGLTVHRSARMTPCSSSGRDTQSDMPAHFMFSVSKPARMSVKRHNYMCGHIGHTAATMTASIPQQTSL
jgi:hypothetical protein